MNRKAKPWLLALTKSATKSLNKLERRDRQLIDTRLAQLIADPFAGDVKMLVNTSPRTYRARVGSWRLLYIIEPKTGTIYIVAILRRSSNTY